MGMTEQDASEMNLGLFREEEGRGLIAQPDSHLS